MRRPALGALNFPLHNSFVHATAQMGAWGRAKALHVQNYTHDHELPPLACLPRQGQASGGRDGYTYADDHHVTSGETNDFGTGRVDVTDEASACVQVFAFRGQEGRPPSRCTLLATCCSTIVPLVQTLLEMTAAVSSMPPERVRLCC